MGVIERAGVGVLERAARRSWERVLLRVVKRGLYIFS